MTKQLKPANEQLLQGFSEFTLDEKDGEFDDEEIESNCGYASGYTQPCSIFEQANILRDRFPQLGSVKEVLGRLPVPEGAEGKFVIPRWERFGSTYCQAVNSVLPHVLVYESTWCYFGHLEESSFREGNAKQTAMQQIADEQKGYDLLVVDGQFGILHRGRGVRRVRQLTDGSCQFCFGAFENLIMLLTHRNRLGKGDLWIDCAGDEYAHGEDDSFTYAPIVYCDHGRLHFRADFIGRASAHSGSSTGFLPR